MFCIQYFFQYFSSLIYADCVSSVSLFYFSALHNYLNCLIMIVSQVTLSGLLNFIDGIWSCCGEERIIVFTTNHIEKLDPALLRPGRMDMHIHMSYCTISAFKQLAFNYLGILHHPIFIQIEELLKKADITPAEIAGQLMKNPDPNISIRNLLRFLKKKVEAQGSAKTKVDVCSYENL